MVMLPTRAPRSLLPKGPDGDAANVILTAVGCKLRFILTWLSSLLHLIALIICPSPQRLSAS
jgi:hypothetical protein